MLFVQVVDALLLGKATSREVVVPQGPGARFASGGEDLFKPLLPPVETSLSSQSMVEYECK